MSRTSRLSWVRWFIEDYLGGVQQMDCRQVGQYTLMLCAQWCAERGAERTAVRDADGALRAILRGDDLDPEVRAKFASVEIAGRRYLRNERMSKEIAHSEKERADRARGAERIAERDAERPLSGTKPEPDTRLQKTEKRISRVRATSWTAEACSDWQERFNGTAPGGRIGRALKPLLSKHPWEEVREAWRSYLAQTEAEFASAERFAQTFGKWNGSSRPAVNSKAQASSDVLRAMMQGSLKGDGTLDAPQLEAKKP